MTSFRNQARKDRRRVKRLKPPDTTRMWRIYVPGRRATFYYPSKQKRDHAFSKFVDAIKLDPQR